MSYVFVFLTFIMMHASYDINNYIEDNLIQNGYPFPIENSAEYMSNFAIVGVYDEDAFCVEKKINSKNAWCWLTDQC